MHFITGGWDYPEARLNAEMPDKQTQFKNNVVADDSFGVISNHGNIIGSEHEDSILKIIDRTK